MRSSRQRRPWYVLVALFGTLAFGLGDGWGGGRAMELYLSSHIEAGPELQRIVDDVDRAQVLAAFDRLIAAYDHCRAWLFPLAIATMLIGTTMMIFATRAISGRANTRSMLVQLAVVQALLAIATFIGEREVRMVEHELRSALLVAVVHATRPDVEVTERSIRAVSTALGFLPAIWLAIRTFVSGFFVVALTRPRARDFFEAPSNPAIER